MDTSTETRSGRAISWRRVLVAFLVIVVAIGLLAGFFIAWAGGLGSVRTTRTLSAIHLAFDRSFGLDKPSTTSLFVPYSEVRNDSAASTTISIAAPKTTEPTKTRSSSRSTGSKAVTPSAESKCTFQTSVSSTRSVIFSEIAWMGTAASADAEWLEIFDRSGQDVPLSGWSIVSRDGVFSLRFGDKDILAKDSTFLLERGSDSSLPNLADQIFSGRLANQGEDLQLLDRDCRVVDALSSGTNWKDLGGDNTTKRTAERDLNDLSWHSSLFAGGTPDAVPLTAPVAPNLPSAASTTKASSTVKATGQNISAIYISEVFAGSEGDSDNEFVELYNSSDISLDLTGCALKKISSTGSASSLVSASRFSDVTIPARQHLLLGNTDGYVGSVSADVSWPHSYTLAARNNGLALYDSTGIETDRISWTDLPAGRSFARDAKTAAGQISSPTPEHRD